MATYNKFRSWVDYLQGNVSGQSVTMSDTFKFMLTNTAPVNTNVKYSDISGTELANGNGYTTGGASAVTTAANATGTETVTTTATTWTATGSMGPFRYVVFYDATPTDKPLVAWWDFGSSITLASTQTFSVFPNSSATTGTLYTLT